MLMARLIISLDMEWLQSFMFTVFLQVYTLYFSVNEQPLTMNTSMNLLP